MKKKACLIPLALGALLVSCGGGNSSTSVSSSFPSSSGNSSSSSSSSSVSDKVGSVYEAVSLLSKSNNYRVETEAVSTERDYTYNNYFTKSYTYCDYSGGEEGYAYEEGKLFRFNLYKKEFIASESFTDDEGKDYSGLYESSLFTSLSSLPLKAFEGSSDKEITVTNKECRLKMLSFLGLSASNYTKIDSLRFSLPGDSINGFYITLTLSTDTVYYSSIADFGSCSNSKVAEWLIEDGRAMTPDPLLSLAKKSFATDNYTSPSYSTNPYEDTDTPIGAQYFLPDYYYGNYTTSSLSIYSKGYLSIPNTTFQGHQLDGAYLFMLNSTLTAFNTLALAQPAFTTNISSMRDIMNYPSKLAMWDHNLQFFEEDDSYTSIGYDDGFTTKDGLILNDFVTNFQVANLIPEGATSAYPTSLSIAIKDGNDPDKLSDNKVDFFLALTIDGVAYKLRFGFENFTTSNIAVVDETLKTIKGQ